MARKPKFPPDWLEHPWPTSVVLGIDQSLANTGWALLSFRDGHRPRLEDYGTIVTKPSDTLTSYADSLARGEEIYTAVRGLMQESLVLSWEGITVVHETPAIDTLTGHRPAKIEGGPIAAMVVRTAALECAVDSVHMVHAQHAKRVVVGTARADKGDVKKAVLEALDNPPKPHRVNEHVCDAIALALTAAVDGLVPDRRNRHAEAV